MAKTKKDKDEWFKNFLAKKGWGKYTSQLLVVKDWTIIILQAFLLATIFKTFFYENFKIPSGSMNPTLLNGDRVLVNKYHYGYSKFSFPFNFPPINDRVLANHKPKRGDIIVFKPPKLENTDIYYIKRIIGLPNDKIQLRDNQVYVNDVPMKYKTLGQVEAKTTKNHNSFSVYQQIENNGDVMYDIFIEDINSIAGNGKPYFVPDGYYFCMGDNRDNSKDSRFPDVGMVPFRNIVGRAERIFFSTANGEFNINRIFQNIRAQNS